MQYQFKCERHGKKPIHFEVSQPMMVVTPESTTLAEHKANCPECGEPAQRVFSSLNWWWANSVYRPDGSYRQDEDYAVLKG